MLNGKSHRVGGWGLPLSDEGSGAWLGCEALRRVLWALDGRIGWTPLLRALFAEFADNPHAIVRWAQTRDATRFRIACAAASSITPAAAIRSAANWSALAAGHIDALAARLIAARRDAAGAGRRAARRSSSRGSAEAAKSRLVEPLGDALHGAVHLARAAAQSLAQVA